MNRSQVLVDRRHPADLIGDVAIECDAEGQTYRGSGIVEESRESNSGTTLLIRGSGALDRPEARNNGPYGSGQRV